MDIEQNSYILPSNASPLTGISYDINIPRAVRAERYDNLQQDILDPEPSAYLKQDGLYPAESYPPVVPSPVDVSYGIVDDEKLIESEATTLCRQLHQWESYRKYRSKQPKAEKGKKGEKKKQPVWPDHVEFAFCKGENKAARI